MMISRIILGIECIEMGRDMIILYWFVNNYDFLVCQIDANNTSTDLMLQLENANVLNPEMMHPSQLFDQFSSPRNY